METTGKRDDHRTTLCIHATILAYNFHDENNEHLALLHVQAGSDATSAFWQELDSQLPLFASHEDFLKQVAMLHNAHW